MVDIRTDLTGPNPPPPPHPPPLGLSVLECGIGLDLGGVPVCLVDFRLKFAPPVCLPLVCLFWLHALREFPSAALVLVLSMLALLGLALLAPFDL
jgi:hypothetical protein